MAISFSCMAMAMGKRQQQKFKLLNNPKCVIAACKMIMKKNYNIKVDESEIDSKLRIYENINILKSKYFVKQKDL